MYEDAEQGIELISFFPAGTQPGDTPPMKISRGEERVFVWCFFLAMMEVEGWADRQSDHIFIDDPISSLDDHNIFVTASTLYDLIEQHFGQRKIIIATHHVGIFSILCDWLMKGEKSKKFNSEKKGKKKYNPKARILSNKQGDLTLENQNSDVFLYHLRVLQLLDQAQRDGNVRAYHFALLRQALESVSSFFGAGRFSYVLKQIGFEDANEIARIVNALAHKNVYYYDSDLLVPDNLALFEEILKKLYMKFPFRTHAPAKP